MQDDELEREIEAHLSEAEDEYVRRGLPPTDARVAARRDFGSVLLTTEAHREIRRGRIGTFCETLAQDVRHSLRGCARQPLFTSSVVAILSLGIGLVTSIVTLLNAQLLRQWQVPAPGSMAVIRPRELIDPISVAGYRFLRGHAHTIQRMAVWRSADCQIDFGTGSSISVQSAFVNADYFDAFGVGMGTGRGFVPEEEDYGAPKAVAVISDRLWGDRFGRDKGILGRSIRIEKTTFTIVGVAGADFADVQNTWTNTDVWVPLPNLTIVGAGVDGAQAEFADPHGYTLERLAGRLAPGATRAQAGAELSALSAQFRRSFSIASYGIVVADTRPFHAYGVPLPARQLRTYELCVLASLVILLLACVNVGNLLLARGLSRRQEVAVRLCLGASRGRIVRKLMTEAAVLALAGTALGFLVAWGMPRLMLALGVRLGGPSGFLLHQDAPVRASFYSPDWVVLATAGGLGAVVALIAGLVPALRVTRLDLSTVAAERHGLTVGGARLQRIFLAAQVTLTLSLLGGAARLARAAADPAGLTPGFSTTGLQVVSVKTRGRFNLKRAKAFTSGLNDALKDTGLPAAALAMYEPFSTTQLVMMARRPDDPPGTFHDPMLRPVTRNYFSVLGIPIVRGRVPDRDDDSRQIVVSESAARMIWPNEDAVGKTLLSAMGGDKFDTCEVVGIAKDVPTQSMSIIDPVVYQAPEIISTVLVRADAAGLAERVRAVAVQIEPSSVVSLRPYASYVAGALGMAAVGSQVGWVVGTFGLALAMVGAFAVFVFAVESRRREIGIRLALGAGSRHVVRLLLDTAGRALAWGVLGGLLLTTAATPVLRQFVYGLSPIDVVAFVETVLIVAAATALATWIPIRRALGVDPVTSLREQ